MKYFLKLVTNKKIIKKSDFFGENSKSWPIKIFFKNLDSRISTLFFSKNCFKIIFSKKYNLCRQLYKKQENSPVSFFGKKLKKKYLFLISFYGIYNIFKNSSNQNVLFSGANQITEFAQIEKWFFKADDSDFRRFTKCFFGFFGYTAKK